MRMQNLKKSGYRVHETSRAVGNAVWSTAWTTTWARLLSTCTPYAVSTHVIYYVIPTHCSRALSKFIFESITKYVSSTVSSGDETLTYSELVRPRRAAALTLPLAGRGRGRERESGGKNVQHEKEGDELLAYGSM